METKARRRGEKQEGNSEQEIVECQLQGVISATSSPVPSTAPLVQSAATGMQQGSS